jgi:hypothetical protein
MRISFRKISDGRHALELMRDDGTVDCVECETRSYLVHDLLHYAVESEAELQTGFWGHLAGGKTLAEMSDRTGASMARESDAMAAIERLIGALTAATKGVEAEQVARGVSAYLVALNVAQPDWLDAEFVRAVQERMRKLRAHWKATPYGEVMVLDWAS